MNLLTCILITIPIGIIFTQLYTLMHQSHKIKAAPKFKLRCGFYLSIFNSYYLYHNFII